MTEAPTRYGPVRGDGGAFRGIPYAAAERFQPPQPPAPWTRPLDCTRYGPHCPQLTGMLEKHLGLFPAPQLISEQCLYLNVFTPGGAGGSAAGRRPVLVWIHGGAFTTGGSGNPWYDGTVLAAAHDVVVITVNYRLGIFGFAGAANTGLLDQIAALRWVHDNVASFGGDPGNVTVFGESAGGTSVLCLLASPRAAGLVHRALLMSPSLEQVRGTALAAAVLADFRTRAGTADLGRLPVAELLAVQQELLAAGGYGVRAFAPTAGGAALPGDPARAAARSPVPVVIGTTRDEMQLFAAQSPVRDDGALSGYLAATFGDLAGDAELAYRAARPGAGPERLAAAVETDRALRVPARQFAQARARLGQPVWMYWFCWASSGFGGALGSCHGLDIPFFFDNLHQPGVDRFTGTAAGRPDVARHCTAALLGLARAADPGWSGYDERRRLTYQIAASAAETADPERDLRLLWERQQGACDQEIGSGMISA